jgi:hypothetical protein
LQWFGAALFRFLAANFQTGIVGIIGNSNILASIFNRASYARKISSRGQSDIFFKSRRRAIFENSPKNDYFTTNSHYQRVRRRRTRLRPFPAKKCSPRKSHQKSQTTGECQTSCRAARCDRGSSLHHTDERVRREGEETPPVDAGEATWAFETRSGERPPRSPRRRPRSRGRANRAAESEPEPPCWRCEAGASPRTESSRGRARTDRIPGRSPPPLTVSTPNVCADRLGDA